MRLVFCGTPAFAVPALQALRSAGHSIELVLCQPDRPSGRGLALSVPPVKQAALEAGLEVLQPEKIRNNAELQARLEAIRPDAIIVVAYGRLIPDWMLNLPRYGNLNLHGSLLPKYRGAAPIQWAVANGETVTGVTTMRLDEGMDTGDMLLRREIPIGPTDTAEDLFPRLAGVGAPLMAETLAGLEAGTHRTAEAGRHSCHACAAADSRGWAGRPGAHGAIHLQPLARLPTLAGRMDDGAREEADPAPAVRLRLLRRAASLESFVWKAIGFSSLQATVEFSK